MISRLALILFLISQLYSLFLSAQKNKAPIEITAGFELRSLVPLASVTMSPFSIADSARNFTAEISYEGGFGFGGIVRAKLTDFWNIESGIYYTRRRYSYRITDPSVDFDQTTDLRSVAYEIPIKGLVYIQMADRLFMNVALGASVDFYASDLETNQLSYTITMFKTNWVRAAVLGSVGLEFRTEKDGYFYIGGSFHQPIGDILTTQVSYSRDNVPPAYFQNASVDGAYFSVDFRYFFAPKSNDKPKVRQVVPDWKNL